MASPPVIGLTGGIGAGKSTVSARLAALGGVVVDADRIAREVVEPGSPAYAAVLERFGPAIVSAEGGLDRAALAAAVFDDPQALAELNAIVHPPVRAVIAERLAAESATDHVVILEIPLLTESGRTPEMAGVLVVDCPEETALRRLVEQRGMDEVDARRRMAAQIDRARRLESADFVVDNSGSPEALKGEIDRAWDWIQSLRA